MTNELEDRDSRLLTSMNVGNILIIIIFTLSLILEWFSIWIAIIVSLLLWLLFANILVDVTKIWKQKAILIEKGGTLHQYCGNCGLRFSSEKSQCPKCGTQHVQSLEK